MSKGFDCLAEAGSKPLCKKELVGFAYLKK